MGDPEQLPGRFQCPLLSPVSVRCGASASENSAAGFDCLLFCTLCSTARQPAVPSCPIFDVVRGLG